MLASAQQSLRAALWNESMKESTMRHPATRQPFWARLFGYGHGEPDNESPGGPRPAFRLGLAAAATLSIGFLVGYVTFHNVPAAVPVPHEQSTGNGQYSGISNIQILDVNATDGEVDIIYDQVRPVHLKTSVADQRVQDVLTYALLNDENPGVRLKAISAFEAVQMTAPPEDMKQAFLDALTSDPNAGVRLQALLLLRRLPFDKDVKSTLLFVLSHDENPGIRVAAMNYLAEITLEGSMPEREMYDILGSKLPAD
jgi:hypothetical protein